MQKHWDISGKTTQDQAKKIVDIMLEAEGCPDLIRCRLHLELSDSTELLQADVIVIEAAIMDFEEFSFDQRLSSNLQWIEIDVLQSKDYETFHEQFGMPGIVVILNDAEGRPMRSLTNTHLLYSTSEDIFDEDHATTSLTSML